MIFYVCAVLTMLLGCTTSTTTEAYDPSTSHITTQASTSGTHFINANTSTTLLGRGDSFLGGDSGTTLNQNEWDVQCGSGLCSRGDPLCCGSSREYCIPGGQKCCSGIGDNSVDHSNIASCGLDQECCQGGADLGFAIDCCNKTQTCTLGRCTEDPCANTTSQEFCLESPQCSWCCFENKCQLTQPDGQEEGNQCGIDQVQNLVKSSTLLLPALRKTANMPQCNPCTMITDCVQCVNAASVVGTNARNTLEKSGCTWCAQTQSCWPTDVVTESGFCNNDQTAQDAVQCQAVGPTGRGLIIVASKTNDFGTIVLATFGFTILAIVGLALFRYLMFRRRMREFLAMMDPNGDFGTGSGRSGAKRELCKRFGFNTKRKKNKSVQGGAEEDGASAGVGAEGPTLRQPDPLPAPILEGREDVVACLACGADTRLPTPKTEAPPCPPPEAAEEEDEEEEDAAVGSPNLKEGNDEMSKKSPLSEKEGDATIADLMGAHTTTATNSPTAAGSQPSSSKDRSEAPTVATNFYSVSSASCVATAMKGDGPKNTEPREMIIALPCYHHLCIVCGRRAVEEGRRKQAEALRISKEAQNKEDESASKSKKSSSSRRKVGGEEGRSATATTASASHRVDDDDNDDEVTALLISPEASDNEVPSRARDATPESGNPDSLSELQLQCPKCQGPIECMILPAKIIHN